MLHELRLVTLQLPKVVLQRKTGPISIVSGPGRTSGELWPDDRRLARTLAEKTRTPAESGLTLAIFLMYLDGNCR